MIVTREKVINVLNSDNEELKKHYIGRALVVLLKNQTQAEQAENETKIDNDIGFTSADAKSGSISAKYYLKHKTLQDWQVERWMKPNKKGVPRLAKYWAQLNVAAEAKAKSKA